MSPDAILQKAGQVIRETVRCGPIEITRATRATDVRGWDSLSHTMIIMQLEDAFGVALPLERVVAATCVGDLVDLLAELQPNPGSRAS